MRSNEPEFRVTRRVVIHDMRPTTLFGRAIAFVFSLLALAAAFFFSLVFFAIIATAVLSFLAFAWWQSRRITGQDKIIEADWIRETDEVEEKPKYHDR